MKWSNVVSAFAWFHLLSTSWTFNINEVNLPREHLRYFLGSNPELGRTCAADAACVERAGLDEEPSNVCWGYEHSCTRERAYHVQPICPGDHRGWVKTKAAQIETFYTQADFGYVKEQIDDLMVMCEPKFVADSSLECSKYLRFCRGRNLMLNFTGLVGRGDNLRYKMDVLGPGQIGGHCELHSARLMKEAEHMSPLQSWSPELVHFVRRERPVLTDDQCDVVVSEPTYIMKLDATVNMYHHFCDFFNLYASLHVNSTHPSAFSKNNRVLVWETFTYDSAFRDAWDAFTDRPVWDLKHVRGKVVCFKNVVFPLLPRMIFGLYYNTPLIYGCERSGLFHAFSRHILASLNIDLEDRINNKVRITLLSRETRYRGIMNEKELLRALEAVEGYEVRRVVYDRSMPLRRQLHITHNSDVLVGMHGAGLTHALFLPDWAAVFEVYNCEDAGCYSDLTRLRGLKYVTWERPDKLVQEDQGHHPNGGSHAKFTNYSFDVVEFLRLVATAAEHVRARSDFRDHVRAAAAAAAGRDEL